MKKAYIVVTIIMMVMSLSGCKNSNKLDYNLVYNQMGIFGYKHIDNVTYKYHDSVVLSYEQLLNDCIEWNNDALNESSINYNSELSKLIRSYDEQFFNEKNLIIISFETGNYLKTKVKNIVLNDSILSVNLKQTTKYGNFTTEAYDWLMVIEIDKLNLDNINLIINIK
ncbi:MAG: hypothetical protein NC182_05595 [Prevotella sp.]|nr:hypothetical protein [Staphylococcus sp.]MCM1350659.1 hypothetical protein [Prevotella sp.]